LGPRIPDKFGKVHAREPGLVVRRAVVTEDNRSALFEINFWQHFKTYASVSPDRDSGKTITIDASQEPA
jgi:hypothetical protein